MVSGESWGLMVGPETASAEQRSEVNIFIPAMYILPSPYVHKNIVNENYSERQNKFDFHYNYFINIALHIRSLRSLRAYRLIVNEKIFFSFTILFFIDFTTFSVKYSIVYL